MNHLPPEETSPEELKRSWEVKHQQHEIDVEVKSKQLEDHRDFLDKRQIRLEEWEKQLIEIDGKKHYTITADTGRLGANMGETNGGL